MLLFFSKLRLKFWQNYSIVFLSLGKPITKLVLFVIITTHCFAQPVCKQHRDAHTTFSRYLFVFTLFTPHTGSCPSTGVWCHIAASDPLLPLCPQRRRIQRPVPFEVAPRSKSSVHAHSMFTFRTRGAAVGAESRVNTVECPDRLTPVTDAFGLRKITRELVANALIPARCGNPGVRRSGCHAKCKSLVIAGRLLKIRMVVW